MKKLLAVLLCLCLLTAHVLASGEASGSRERDIGSGDDAIYDAAGCTAYVYGSSILGGNVGITVCRAATLTTDILANAIDIAKAPYDGEADPMIPAATADGAPMYMPDGSMPPDPPADLAPGEEPPGGSGGID